MGCFGPLNPFIKSLSTGKLYLRVFGDANPKKYTLNTLKKKSFGDIDMLIVVRWKNRRMTQNAVGTQQKISSIKSWFLVVLSLAVVEMHSAPFLQSWGYYKGHKRSLF